jgi:hypothetical protein
MSEYKIEDGIPMPGRKGGATTPWPWPKMEVDQSVFFPAIKDEGTKPGPNAIYRRVNPYPYGSKHNKTFKTRWIKHNGKLGLRVWRVK